MNNLAIDQMRLEANRKLDPERKSELGQFMTPSAIANYMASLFTRSSAKIHLLDAGAGIGSLTTAVLNIFSPIAKVDAWEIDPIMSQYLEKNLDSLEQPYEIHSTDFIIDSVNNIKAPNNIKFTHSILNPPYKKIATGSLHRQLLRQVGIETVNLYTAFLALVILQTVNGGEIVAIIPRSFCNGPYYKPFRELLLKMCSIDHIHIFEARNKAFKDDAVLQENMIIKLTKSKQKKDVTLSSSLDGSFLNYSEYKIPFLNIVKKGDSEKFIHVPLAAGMQKESITTSLKDLGLQVATGPVVDFRLKEYWREQPSSNAVQLIYPHHFTSNGFEHPRSHKKPNALLRCDETKKWLMPKGYYVLIKRFSSKEEKKRVTAYVLSPKDITDDWVGFENHWNVIHINKAGLDKEIAYGLACFLNSTYLDQHFRVFSGHTQVNATDLRNMVYPTKEQILRLGRSYSLDMTQSEIDLTIEKLVS